MTKSEYLSNSAKLFTISSAILLVATGCILLGDFNSKIGSYGATLSKYSFYIVFFMSALALNGEGIGYKRGRDFAGKKRCRVLKFFLAISFIVGLFKKPIEDAVLSIAHTGALGIIVKIFMSVVNTACAYSFLFTMVAFIYMLRDRSEKRVYFAELFTFVLGVIYAFYRTFYYAVTKYSLTEFGDGFVSFFSNIMVIHFMSMVLYAFVVVMCLFVMCYYNSKVLGEHDDMIKERKNMVVATKIYNTDLVGIDTLEDDFLLPVAETEDY